MAWLLAFTAEKPLVTAENWDWELELGRRIDYMMVRCSDHGPTLDVRACERIFDEPVKGVWGSDHFGVVADLSAQTSGRTTGALTALLLLRARAN